MGIHWCDFWVILPRKGESPLQVAVELKIARKNYGRSDLIDPIENQLWKKYMQPSDCRHGIYVVLWFRDKCRYDYPTSWTSSQQLTTEVTGRSEEVAKAHGIALSSYVIDLTAPHREH